jgi:Glycosyl hydrolase catalytic core
MTGCAAAMPAMGQAATYKTGVGDQDSTMFQSPFYKALHTRITRFIAPYNIVTTPSDLAAFRVWLAGATADHEQPLIAFYHSRVGGTHMPSVATYTKDIKKFMKDFPSIKNYTPWNESNRGNVTISGGASFHSPTASQAAQYYLALKKNCKGCTIVGLEVLDGSNPKPTITYIKSFQKDVEKAHGKLPTVWGLHNYSDTNRFRDAGTKDVLKAVKGQVWLTETGGLVNFGGAFPYSLTRANKAVAYMFKLAKSNKRITRLYIYNWFGDPSTARFDAGLADQNGTPRPAYFTVLKQLTGL